MAEATRVAHELNALMRHRDPPYGGFLFLSAREHPPQHPDRATVTTPLEFEALHTKMPILVSVELSDSDGAAWITVAMLLSFVAPKLERIFIEGGTLLTPTSVAQFLERHPLLRDVWLPLHLATDAAVVRALCALPNLDADRLWVPDSTHMVNSPEVQTSATVRTTLIELLVDSGDPWTANLGALSELVTADMRATAASQLVD